MLLMENTMILKQTFPNTWAKLKELEKNQEFDFLQVEETRRGDKTLSVTKDGKTVYLHSKYNPLREAEAIVNEYEEVKEGTTVVFYGTGLGYHIDLFLKKYPKINYYIYEPIPELLYTYLTHKPIKELPSKNLKDIVMGLNEQETLEFLNRFIDKNRGEVLLVELPNHKQIFPDEYEKFLEIFTKTVKNKRTALHTNYAYQKRWIINSMKNFGEVLSTPNIIMGNKGKFKDKPVLLVAAGPSLNEEIENIRYIKKNGLAYIFSVGSAINTLIYYQVFPHAACTYDPSVRNQIVFEKIKTEGIKEIPLIFGSSVGYETLENYPGEKCHMITSQDTVSNYFLKTKEDERLDIMLDAPTIAVVTMQLLFTLGFNPIVLVGQNLAYRGKKQHSSGIEYSSEVTEEQMAKGVRVKDVYGNEALTNEGFNLMRKQMESYIKGFSKCKVINTTKGGAHIEGAPFLELDKVIEKNLTEKVYDKDWLNIVSGYDQEYLKNQLGSMDKAYKQALKFTDEYYDIIDKIKKLINNKNYKEAEKMYIKLDKVLANIERNKFFKTFILPMNRIQYKILADSIDSLNEEKNPATKGKRIIESFKRFIDLCKDDTKMIKPYYQELQEQILSYRG